MKKIRMSALVAVMVSSIPAGVAGHGGHAAEHGTILATLSHLGVGHVLVALAVLVVGGVAVAAFGRSRLL